MIKKKSPNSIKKSDITSAFKMGDKDLEILELLMKRSHTIIEISRKLNMDYKNAHRYCLKLHSLRQVYLDPPPGKSRRGSPITVSIAIHQSGDDPIYSVLSRIADRNGRIPLSDYYKLFSKNNDFLQENGVNGKNTNLLQLELFSGYLTKEIVLTEKGIKFLTEYGNRHNKKQPLKNKMEKMENENSLKNDSDKISH